MATIGQTLQSKNAVQRAGQERPDIVLIRIITPADIGLREVSRDAEREIALDKRNEERAKAAGMNTLAFLLNGGSGRKVIERAHGVSLRRLVDQLEVAGYRFNGGHRFQREGAKFPTNVIEFRLGADGVEMPAAIERLLDAGVFDAQVFENHHPDGRLDCVNALHKFAQKKPAEQHVLFTGKGYKVVRALSADGRVQ